MKFGSAKSSVVLLFASVIAFAAMPARAGSLVDAGMTVLTPLDILAGSTFAAGPPPPPPPPVSYYPTGYGPVAGVPGLRCGVEPQQIWNGYGYVVEPVRVCN